MEGIMTKWQQINEIIATRPPEILLAALWDDPAVLARVRAILDDVSIENIPYYHKHFVGEIIRVLEQ